MPVSRVSSWKTLAENWGPLSEMMRVGSPKRLYRFWWMRCVVPSASMVFVQGARITPFVASWSAMTMRESKPLDGGRSVMKLIVVVSNGYAFGFAGIGISGGAVG